MTVGGTQLKMLEYNNKLSDIIDLCISSAKKGATDAEVSIVKVLLKLSVLEIRN